MKCRIKHADHRYIRHDLAAGIDSDQIRRIVKRRQIVTFLNGRNDFRCDDNGTGKLLAAVNDPVSHRIDLLY